MDDELLLILKKFREKKILVIGDIMLDKHIQGDVNRISPEAPVCVLHVKKESLTPGGAANVATNIISMDGTASISGIAGDDSSMWQLLCELEKRNISTAGIVIDKKRRTTQKIKLISKNQQLLRLDQEDTWEADSEVETKLAASFDSAFASHDAMVISDYGKGTMTSALARGIIAKCRSRGIPVIVDAKPKSVRRYAGADLITLNAKEAGELSKIDAPGKEQISGIGKRLVAELSSSIIITAGKDGMFVFGRDGDDKTIEAQKIELTDPSGAGDSVTAALALSLASGSTLYDAARIANYAGAISVSRPGIVNPTLLEMQNILRTEISEQLKENIRVKQTVINNHIHEIEKITNMITDVYHNDKKVLIFGNGGSAADAMHFAAELVGRYKMERRGLPAINLTADSSIMTAVGNDYGFDMIFERQVEALARKDDVLIGISTSGNSENVIRAMKKGKEIGAKTICFLGKDGGKLKDLCDVSIIVPSNNTPRIQETHITIVHIICELLEKKLFKKQ